MNRTTWGMIIDGQETDSSSGATYERVSPASGEVVGTFPKGDVADVDRAVAATRRAFDEGEWQHVTGAERSTVLHALAERLRDRADDYARLESQQVGIPFGQIRGSTTTAPM